ncbi:MAG: hypothetical protein QOE63_1612 [Acidimicrobiaceae bacterium]|jgi:hypothetical protein
MTTTSAPSDVGRVRGALAALRDADPILLVCRASLLLLLIDAREDPRTIIAAAIIVVVAFYRERLCTSPWLWLGIGVPVLVAQLWRWEGLDDHVVLTSYWFCAVGLALLSDDPRRALRTTGRLLVGLTFACATIWKLTSSEYLSGAMFHELLLDDSRFRLMSQWLGGVSQSHLHANADIVTGLAAPGADLAPHLADTGTVGTMAMVLTYWTLVIEAALAVTWLAGDRLTRPATRIVLLLVFCLTTYVALPVTAFAAVLITMALATTAPGDRTRLWLVGAFTFLALYSPLWTAVVKP